MVVITCPKCDAEERVDEMTAKVMFDLGHPVHCWQCNEESPAEMWGKDATGDSD